MPRRATAKPPPKRRPPTTLTGQDLEVAKRDALLQLRIGRSAHLLTVAVSALLGVDAILLLFFFPSLPTLGSGVQGAVAVWDTAYLLPPLVAALMIGVAGLVVKWSEFNLWPWEGHFSVSVAGVALAALAAVLYIGRVAGAGPLATLALFPLMLLVSFGTVTIALLGLALTWKPWGSRQWASAVCAGLPMVTTGFLYFPPSQAGTGSEPLAVALLISAVLYQTSGSLLHLLSSGTATHRQALVLSGQDRIGKLADEIRQKEEALRFRELAVLRRESDAETAETVARRGHETLSAAQERLTALDSELRERATALLERERELAGRTAELDGKTRSVEEQERTAAAKAEQLNRTAVILNDRAVDLSHRAGELAQKDVELAHRDEEVKRRAGALPEAERRMADREKQLEEKTAELLRREGDISAREQAEQARTGVSSGAPTPAEQDVVAREARVRHLKSLLDQQNEMLGQRAQEAATQAHNAEMALRQVAERNAQLAAREATLAQQEANLAARLHGLDERQSQVDAALGDYRARLNELAAQQSDIARKKVEIDHALGQLPAREQSLVDREARVAATAAALERREGELLARERAADAREAENSLRRQEIDIASAETSLAAALSASVAAPGRIDAEDEGMTDASRAAAPGARTSGTSVPGTLAPTHGRHYADRLPTGTPRLDDLLLGGLPPKSQVALVGEAFVGKEVALYAFVAEGLKRSEPAVMVTVTRSPEEISESLGLVLPQFREYEQLGKVVWIDASGSGAAAGPHRLVPPAADGLTGILQSLVAAAKQIDASGAARFRVGFLGLSSAIAHGDERAGFAFLQNLIGILKPREAIAMYSLEAGSLSEAQVESLLSRMDGAILFRQDRDRTFLSVKGFGDVETREWIECRATNRALIIGSFALERIR
jgi:KaiC/GvpD/RAD55 family RecA-like ATPase